MSQITDWRKGWVEGILRHKEWDKAHPGEAKARRDAMLERKERDRLRYLQELRDGKTPNDD